MATAVRAELREMNRVAREVAIKRGAVMHPRIAALKGRAGRTTFDPTGSTGPDAIAGWETALIAGSSTASTGRMESTS